MSLIINQKIKKKMFSLQRKPSSYVRKVVTALLLTTLFYAYASASYPTIYASAPQQQEPNPTAIKSAYIDGDKQGALNKSYTFSAQVTPKESAQHATYTWFPTPTSGQGTSEATYSWLEADKQLIKVSISDKSDADKNTNSVEASHTILIKEESAINVESATISAAISGGDGTATLPPAIRVDDLYTVTLDITPVGANQYTIYWQPEPNEGQGKTQAVFSWRSVGEKQISAFVFNADDTTIEAEHSVRVTTSQSTIYLPAIETGNAQQNAQQNAQSETELQVAQAPKIVGGEEADVGEYPWQAALMLEVGSGNNRRLSFFCGGSLIDEEWVMTAAHCIDNLVGRTNLFVVLGRHRRSSNVGETIRVSEIIPHPNYNARTSNNDIALLRLSQQSQQQVVPYAIHEFDTGDPVTVTGWGRTVDGDADSLSDVLMEVSVPVVSQQQCRRSYGTSDITDNMICAGSTGLDSCQGDSGGPLMIPDANGSIVSQIGVVSFGIGCGSPGYPGVYTKVSNYLKWIEDTLGGTPETDEYEPDNRADDATSITANGEAQTHDFHAAGDEDWISFSADESAEYIIETSNLGAEGDTVIDLFDGSGNQLATDDDGGEGRASKIVWTAASNGTLFIKVRHYQASESGSDTTYDIAVTGSAPPPPSGTSDEDTFEPDNSNSTASEIVTNGTVQQHTIHVASDEDWVKFTAQAGYEYTIETANLGEETDTIIYLYDEQINNLSQNDDGGEGFASKIVWTAAADELLFVQTRHYDPEAGGATMRYDLSITAVDMNEEADDMADQFEPDDSAAESTELVANASPQIHNFHVAGDTDWFVIQIEAGTIYTIETGNLGPESDTVLVLLDESENIIAQNDDVSAGNRRSRIIYVAEDDVTVFVTVRHYNEASSGSATVYEIQVRSAEIPTDGDEYEPDNSTNEAISIAVDGSIQPHTIHEANDMDWVRFTAEAGYSYTIETLNLGSSTDTVIALYDSFGNQLIENDNGDTGFASLIEWIAEEGGQYFVVIRDFDSTSGGAQVSYEVRILQGDQNTLGDAFEPDDTQDQATEIATDGSMQRHDFTLAGNDSSDNNSADVDWIKFSATAGNTYTIETSELGTESDTVIELYSVDGDQITVDDDSGIDLASKIEWQAPDSDGAAESATYYVKIRNYRQTAVPETAYSISITATLPEESNSPEQSQLIVTNGNFEEGATGWTEDEVGDSNIIMVAGNRVTAPYEGSWLAHLGGTDDATFYVGQYVEVDADRPYLVYWYWVDSADLCGYDFGGIGVNGNWHTSYTLCTESNSSEWERSVIDLSEFAGETILLDIAVFADASIRSNMYVDSVSFTGEIAIQAAAVQSASIEPELSTENKDGVAPRAVPPAYR